MVTTKRFGDKQAVGDRLWGDSVIMVFFIWASKVSPSHMSLIRDRRIYIYVQIGMRVHPLKHCFNVAHVNSTGLLVSTEEAQCMAGLYPSAWVSLTVLSRFYITKTVATLPLSGMKDYHKEILKEKRIRNNTRRRLQWANETGEQRRERLEKRNKREGTPSTEVTGAPRKESST